MALTLARCTNCGANLQVDSQRDAAICEYCGSAFIVEKAIANYIGTNINASTVNIYNAPAQEKDKYVPVIIQRKSAFIACAVVDSAVIDNHSVGTLTNGKSISLVLSPGIHYLSLGGEVHQIVIDSDCTEVRIFVKARLGMPNGKLLVDRIEYY